MGINRLNAIIIGVLLFAILLCMGYVMYLHKQIESMSTYKSLYAASVAENKVWQDKVGLWRNRAETAEITKDNLDKIKDLATLASEFDGLKKNLKNLENYINVSTTTTIHKTIKLRDTTIYSTIDSIPVDGRYFAYKDKWESDSVGIKGDSATFIHSTKDSLEIVVYYKRSWVLGKKKYETEIKSLNPSTKVTYQKSLKVKRRRSLL